MLGCLIPILVVLDINRILSIVNSCLFVLKYAILTNVHKKELLRFRKGRS